MEIQGMTMPTTFVKINIITFIISVCLLDHNVLFHLIKIDRLLIILMLQNFME